MSVEGTAEANSSKEPAVGDEFVDVPSFAKAYKT